MNYEEVLNYFNNNKDSDFAKFQARLIPTKSTIIGVKVPVIKKYAKTIPNNDLTLINSLPMGKYFEVDMLKGLLISNLKTNIDEVINQLISFSQYIDNWAVCDSVVCNTRFKKDNFDKIWHMSMILLGSNNQFIKRFGIIFLLKYFVKTSVNEITKVLLTTKFGDYYYDMGVSWFYSVSLIHNFDLTINNLKMIRPLSEFIYQKSLQKGIESNRLSLEQKTLLRSLKNNTL